MAPEDHPTAVGIPLPPGSAAAAAPGPIGLVVPKVPYPMAPPAMVGIERL